MDGATARACTSALEVRSDTYKRYPNMKLEADTIESNLKTLLRESME